MGVKGYSGSGLGKRVQQRAGRGPQRWSNTQGVQLGDPHWTWGQQCCRLWGPRGVGVGVGVGVGTIGVWKEMPPEGPGRVPLEQGLAGCGEGGAEVQEGRVEVETWIGVHSVWAFVWRQRVHAALAWGECGKDERGRCAGVGGGRHALSPPPRHKPAGN